MAIFDKAQRRALSLLAVASAFDGITQGVFLLQESIARKALAASDFQITLIGVIANATMLLSFFVSFFFANRGKRKLVAFAYLAGRLMFLLAYFITDSWVFLGFLVLYHGMFAIQLPVFNSFYQRHFGDKRGLAFSLARTLLILCSMACSFAVGKLLDADPGFFRWLLAGVSLSALVTYAIAFKLESEAEYERAPRPRLAEFAPKFRAIVANRPFMFFETVFMTYGMAFMIMVPAVPIFLLDRLKLGYGEMSFAQGIVAQSLILLVTPFAGWIFDRLNMWKISAFSYGVLILYPLGFLAAFLSGSKYGAFAGFAFYSLGLAGVNMLWNLGAVAFSKGEGDSFLLQAFHISLTGVRGLIGPFVGLLILSTIGIQWNFVAAIALFAAAAAMSLLRLRKAGGDAR